MVSSEALFEMVDHTAQRVLCVAQLTFDAEDHVVEILGKHQDLLACILLCLVVSYIGLVRLG